MLFEEIPYNSSASGNMIVKKEMGELKAFNP